MARSIYYYCDRGCPRGFVIKKSSQVKPVTEVFPLIIRLRWKNK